MKRISIAIGTGLALGLTAAAAQAGECTAQIDAMTQAMAQMQAAMTQGPGAAKSMPQSATMFAELAQGMMENYTRFMSELTQSGMSFMSQGRRG